MDFRRVATIFFTVLSMLAASTAVHAAIGRTPGAFNVSATGAATYEIPIWIPLNTKGIQPSLALTYNSQGGDGTIGPGWSLSGLSSITRCNKTYAQEGTPVAVALQVSDGYCLNGNRLRLTSASGTYGLSSSTYQTELANFSQITAHGTAGSGPASFTAQGKDGLLYEYGTVPNSRILATGTTTAWQWLLTKVSDRAGNYYSVAYGTGSPLSADIGVPLTIVMHSASEYGPQTWASLDYQPRSSVGANSSIVGYVGGTQVANTKLLTSVAIKRGGPTLRKYALTYQAAPVTGRARLAQVKECTDETLSDCLSPTIISYQDGSAGVSPPTNSAVTGAHRTILRDMDGDGRDDLVYAASVTANTYRWFVKFSAAGGFSSPIDTNVGYTSITINDPNSAWPFVIPNTPSLFDDFLGEGRTSLLTPQNGVWHVVRWNGSAFVTSSIGVSIDSNRPANSPNDFTAADINGDGLPDLVSVRADGGIYTRLNTSSGGTASFASTTTLAYTANISAGHQGAGTSFYYPNTNYLFSGIALYSGAQDDSSGIRRTDFNGDGRTDVSLVFYQFVGDYEFYSDFWPTTLTLISQGSAFTPGPAFGDNFGLIVPVNWNDDNCTDAIHKSPYGTYNANHSTRIYVSGCNSAASALVTIELPAATLALDWNGDGRTDLLSAQYPGVYYAYLSQGNEVSAPIATGLLLNAPVGYAPYHYKVFDQNGDGLDDLVRLDSEANNTLTYGLHNGAGTLPDLATSIIDGNGISFSPTYVSIAQSNYIKGSGAVYPEKDVQKPAFVVGQVAITDASNPSVPYTQTYTYSGARQDMQGRGFLGFQSRTVVDSRAGTPVITSYFETAFPYTGRLRQQDVYQHNDTTLISRTVNTPGLTTLDATASKQRYFPYVASTATDTYEVGGFKSGMLIAQSGASFAYDNFGNLTTSTSTVTDKDATAPQSPTYNQSWTTTVTNTITPDTTNWCLGLPTQTVVTKSGTGVAEAAITRTTRYTPDYVKCRINQQVVEPDSPLYSVTTDLGYDNFGNVNSQTVTGSNMTARTTTTDWGSWWGSNGTFPVSVTNAMYPAGNSLEQKTLFRFDLIPYPNDAPTFLLITRQTDPNGLHAIKKYDRFDRKNSESRQDGTSTVWTYNNCAGVTGGCQNGDPTSSATSINKMVVIATSKDAAGNVIRDDWTYLDQLDRPIVTKSQTLSGGYTRVGVQYDSLGRISRQTAPCDAANCSLYWTQFSYDGLNRVTQVQRPISASNSTSQTTTIAYQGMTTVTADPQSKQTTKITDPNGQMRRSQDHNGYYQNFSYDSFGSLKAVVDSASNALFSADYVYGMGAFQTKTVDMDRGTWNYTPNALGEVIQYTDDNGATFTMTYDKLSRLTTRSVPGDGTTTWVWGVSATSFNIGQLQSINNTGGTTENFSYDNKGRLSQRQIVSDDTYNYNYAYNSTTGMLDTLTYPVSTSSYRLTLKYLYEKGLLQQVKDNAASTVFWQANAINARGQVTQETLGNGVVTNRNYDAVTGWINSIQSGVGGGTALQNESYLFDNVGNVIQRQNNMLGLTESFCYDSVYRLTKSALSGDSNCNSSNNLTVAYDDLGNITNRTDVANNATWTYHVTKKHAVTQAGSPGFSYTYDDNGNALTRNGQAIGWNASNYPIFIGGAGESANLYYDGNNARWKQEYANGSGIETTVYAGALLEKVTVGSTVDWRHYIKAGNQTVAVYSRKSSGTNDLRYMLVDHLGSIAKITESTGAAFVSESFTAFGNRRNSSTWSGAPTAADLDNINAVSRKGYTGHDFLGSLGLNHMNGRVQDAIIGRFLSPDPYITQPGNTQNYNRYSYVNNNPLRFTDPTGFSSCPPDCGYTLPPVDVPAPRYPTPLPYEPPHNPYNPGWAPPTPYIPYSQPNQPPGPYRPTAPAAAPTPAPVIATTPVGTSAATAATGAACQACDAQDKTGNGLTEEEVLVIKLGIVMFGMELMSGNGSADEMAMAAVARRLAARQVTNTVPSTLARVIPGKGPFPTLGPPSRSDVFVTAADDIAGLNAAQLSRRLGISASGTFTVIRFPTPQAGLASPINRPDPWFIGRGRTSGGAREFVVPNGPIPSNSTTGVVGP